MRPRLSLGNHRSFRIAHAPAGFRDDHLRPEVVELVPEFFGLQVTLDILQLVRVAGRSAPVLALLGLALGVVAPGGEVVHEPHGPVLDAAALLDVDVDLFVLVVGGFLGALALALAQVVLVQEALVGYHGCCGHDVHRGRVPVCRGRQKITFFSEGLDKVFF